MEQLVDAAKAAGLAGTATLVFYYLFRDVIMKLVLPKLSREQAYRTIRLILVLVFLLALTGIGAWTYLQPPSSQAVPSVPTDVNLPGQTPQCLQSGFDNLSGTCPEIDWKNVKQYFLVKRQSLSKRSAQAPLQFRFLIKARHAFGGTLEAFALDQDEVKICPRSSLSTEFGCSSYDLSVIYDNKESVKSYVNRLFSPGDIDTRLRFWEEGETQWVEISVPHNTARLQVFFSQ